MPGDSQAMDHHLSGLKIDPHVRRLSNSAHAPVARGDCTEAIQHFLFHGDEESLLKLNAYLSCKFPVNNTYRLNEQKITYNTFNYDDTLSRQHHPYQEQATNQNESDVNIICVNADQTPAFAQKMGSGF